MITYKQLTLEEIFEDCQNKFDNDKYQFLSLLDEAINLDEIVPVSFISHFYASTGRPRKHQLYPMLKALLIQRIFSIPTDTLLIVFLKFSQELRDFCGFDVVPDGSKFTRFKQDFLSDLQSMFDHLIDLTEPICQSLDPALASMTIFDTSGIEAWVTENNPKYANRIIKQLKAFKKSHNLDDSYDPYKAAYGSMPTHAAANPAIPALQDSYRIFNQDCELVSQLPILHTHLSADYGNPLPPHAAMFCENVHLDLHFFQRN